MRDNCMHYKLYIDAKDELSKDCHKDYCLCEDKYVWDVELNEKYQTAKKENKAKDGIFSRK
jgi:hypothetical protein